MINSTRYLLSSAVLLLTGAALHLACGGQAVDLSNQSNLKGNKGGDPNQPNNGGPIQPGPDGKFTLCHFPPGNPNNYHPIEVGSKGAVDAHVEHHCDHLGPCVKNDHPTCSGGGEPDAGTPPSGGPDGGSICLPENSNCDIGAAVTTCCTGLACTNNICMKPLG